jgi:hypothetical protein
MLPARRGEPARPTPGDSWARPGRAGRPVRHFSPRGLGEDLRARPHSKGWNSPIDLVPAERRDRVVAARREHGYVLWTEEKLEGFVHLRFLPSA